MTGVVLLVRSALRSDDAAGDTARDDQRQGDSGAPPPAVAARVAGAVLRDPSGDTLDAIAARFATTVDELLRAQPGRRADGAPPGRAASAIK